jgi:RNA polymerase sigma-70 factor (ECF subfamily)
MTFASGRRRSAEPAVEVLLTHLDAVHRLARHLAPPGVNPDDLVQETYLRALDSVPVREIRNPRAWLLTICLNVVRNEARRQSRHPLQLVEPTALVEAGGASRSSGASGMAVGQDPSRDVELAERRRAVGRALAGLPAEQRESVVLVDVVGCTAREAAELIGCPRGTVLARVHRGRRRLVALLESEGVGDDL